MVAIHTGGPGVNQHGHRQQAVHMEGCSAKQEVTRIRDTPAWYNFVTPWEERTPAALNSSAAT